jgi:hypothetical protein
MNAAQESPGHVALARVPLLMPRCDGVWCQLLFVK